MEKQQSQSEEVKTITPKEQAKADCDALCLLCTKMSDALRKSIEIHLTMSVSINIQYYTEMKKCLSVPSVQENSQKTEIHTNAV